VRREAVHPLPVNVVPRVAQGAVGVSGREGGSLDVVSELVDP